jgi:ABC-type uncharacterized transport system fused permease/ATPase subunit
VFFHTLSPRYTQLTNCLLGRIFRNNALYQMSNIDKRIRDPDERITQEVQVRYKLLHTIMFTVASFSVTFSVRVVTYSH